MEYPFALRTPMSRWADATMEEQRWGTEVVDTYREYHAKFSDAPTVRLPYPIQVCFDSADCHCWPAV